MACREEARGERGGRKTVRGVREREDDESAGRCKKRYKKDVVFSVDFMYLSIV